MSPTKPYFVSDERPILGVNLAAARREKGLSQKDVAQALGITDVTVSNHERSVTTPDDETLEAYARLYGQSAARLKYNFEQSDTGFLRAATRPDSPEGSWAKDPGLPWEWGTVRAIQRRADAFEWDMVRLGANDDDARLIRDLVKAFLRAIADRNASDPEGDFAAYVGTGLRPWIVDRIALRSPADKVMRVAEPKPEATYLDPGATSKGKRGA